MEKNYMEKDIDEILKKREMTTIVSRFKPCRVSTFKGIKTVKSYEISRFWRLTLY